VAHFPGFFTYFGIYPKGRQVRHSLLEESAKDENEFRISLSSEKQNPHLLSLAQENMAPIRVGVETGYGLW